jgi:fructose 1,6-bisphosphatase
MEVLRSKYEAVWIDPYSNQKGLEAEVTLPLEGELLLIEISVDATSVRATSIHSFDIRTVKPLEPLRLENKTDSYVTHPQVIKYLDRIKRDIGIP